MSKKKHTKAKVSNKKSFTPRSRTVKSPRKRRSPGESCADGYYYHRSACAVGLYWVLGAIAKMPLDRQIPALYASENMKPARSAFIYALSDNFRHAVGVRRKQIGAAVRHQETYELLHRIAGLKTPQAESDVGDFVKAEAAYSSSLMEYHNDTRCEHLYWLNPSDEPPFAKLAESSQLDVSDPFLASQLQRARLHENYPRQVEYAAREARHFSEHYRLTRKFWFRAYESICRIRPDSTARTDLKKVIRGSNVLSRDHEWFDIYLNKLQEHYDADPRAWEKIVFRLDEPQLRMDEFAAANITGKCPCVRKAYLEWESRIGRYSGIKDTNQNRLLTDSQKMDDACIAHLDRLGILPLKTGDTLMNAAVIRQLSCFSHNASNGNTLMHLAA